MWIGADGKIGGNTVNPTEIYDVNGSVNVSAGSSFKIGGTAIVHAYHNSTNITIGTNKNLNFRRLRRGAPSTTLGSNRT
jgi:hypothetical protein